MIHVSATESGRSMAAANLKAWSGGRNSSSDAASDFELNSDRRPPLPAAAADSATSVFQVSGG
jgi:hypothetical protein